MNRKELRPSSTISTRFRAPNKNKLMTSLLIGIFFIVPIRVQSQNYNLAVDDASQSMAFASAFPGEAQSTIVPPGKKSQCSAGRVLVTNDIRRPPDGGSVVFRDLNNSSNTTFSNTSFDSIPLPTGMFRFGTNDHDIITMPNGNVILIWGIHFATTLNPKPGWFDITTGANLGTGVRRGVMVWRSQDCGQSFQYVGQVDPATTADGSCAFPQYRRDPSTKKLTPVKPYANGGVDGQLIQLDPATKRIYLMFQCVGQKKDLTQTSFTLIADRLNKTMVLMSPDEGATWNMLGWLNTRAWRYGVVPLSQDRLAFGSWNALSSGSKNPNGTYQFDQTAVPTPVADKDWPSFDTTTIESLVYANIYGHTIITRVPGAANGVLIGYTNALESQGKNTNGYSLFFYDRSTSQYSEADPILPLNRDANSFTMHLTAVDLGTGPILLYWYDINWPTKKATIRGRLITGPQKHTGDFEIYRSTAPPLIGRQPIRRPSSFDLGSSKYWYGDYKTAGGYTVGTQMERISGPISRTQVSYNYFPMWVQPDHTVHYIRVRVEPGPTRVAFKPLPTRLVGEWRPGPSPVELNKRKFTAAELRVMLNYNAP
jgi:hypothetical protein